MPNAPQIRIPATYMRGGTSKGVFFRLQDLPPVARVPGPARDALLLLDGQRGQRTHVVEAVGELDHHHPDVLGRGEDHLAEGLGLRLVADVELAGHRTSARVAKRRHHGVELSAITDAIRRQGAARARHVGDDDARTLLRESRTDCLAETAAPSGTGDEGDFPA